MNELFQRSSRAPPPNLGPGLLISAPNTLLVSREIAGCGASRERVLGLKRRQRRARRVLGSGWRRRQKIH